MYLLVNQFDLAEEKEFNPRLTKSKADFVQLMSNLNLAYPKKIDLVNGVNIFYTFSLNSLLYVIETSDLLPAMTPCIDLSDKDN